MIKRFLLIVVLGVSISGCFMAPLALIGPASSGFSTASLIQSGISTGANYVVKQSTGKTITEHVLDSINPETVKQSFAHNNKVLTAEVAQTPIQLKSK